MPRLQFLEFSQIEFTTSQVGMMNADIFGVLQVYSISVETVLRGGYCQVVNQHTLTIVKLEMAL